MKIKIHFFYTIDNRPSCVYKATKLFFVKFRNRSYGYEIAAVEHLIDTISKNLATREKIIFS